MYRRNLIRAAGVTLALPLLDSLRPRKVSANEPHYQNDGVPRRMVCICNNLGLHLPHFIPEGTGYGWKPSRYLKELEQFRKQMTVFSGVSHPEVDGGHPAQKSFLTCAPHPGGSSFKNSISLDQYAVDFIGRETRFPSLALCANGNDTLSWTRAGVPIPGATRPSQVFSKLFLTGSETEVDAQIRRLRHGQSIMDTVMDQARVIKGKLDGKDRQKFDEYVTSVREVERQMVRQQQWERKPKPKVNTRPPKDIRDQADVISRAELMFDLTALALQTDSTRLITIMMEGFFIVPPIAGVEEGYHTVSHHGQNPRKIQQLALIETEHMRALASLLRKLDQTHEQGDTLLDRTMVMYGSNMGNASSHDNRNLPVILAGGGFKHGQHLGFDQSDNYPLPNLYVSMLQRLGIETDRFASSTGTMRGLETV
ncbi:MAG: DUF1552 domain-containing protein [Pirellulaceae bacterium]|nr:DUF1552 domain-containing protein [Pirellulaceae bacterium]